MAASKIKKDDLVRVIAGKDKGKEGKVLSVDLKNHKVLVEGVNKVYKHSKPSAANQQGGIIEKEAPIHVSKLNRINENGKAIRSNGKETKIKINK